MTKTLGLNWSDIIEILFITALVYVAIQIVFFAG